MSPGNSGRLACLGNAPGEHGVAKEAFGLVQLARIDVGLARIAGGVDQKFGTILLQRRGQRGHIGVVQFGPLQIFEGNAPRLQQLLIGLPHIA